MQQASLVVAEWAAPWSNSLLNCGSILLPTCVSTISRSLEYFHLVDRRREGGVEKCLRIFRPLLYKWHFLPYYIVQNSVTWVQLTTKEAWKCVLCTQEEKQAHANTHSSNFCLEKPLIVLGPRKGRSLSKDKEIKIRRE